jgi:CheY-like chemotaxis protein
MPIKKILVLDDEPSLISAVLDRLEYEFGKDAFIYTQYTDECLNILKEGNICCASIDMIMPYNRTLKYNDSVLNGLNILKQIREEYPQLPIACFSVAKEWEIIQAITKLGATYICKNDNDAFYQLFLFYKKYFPK